MSALGVGRRERSSSVKCRNLAGLITSHLLHGMCIEVCILAYVCVCSDSLVHVYRYRQKPKAVLTGTKERERFADLQQVKVTPYNAE